VTWKVTTPPAAEPVDLVQVKAQVRLEWEETDEDVYLESLIKVAREQTENYLGRSLITQTVTLYLDAWPADGVIYLPRGPVQSLTHVKYYDGDGVQQTVGSANYQTDLISTPPRVAPVNGYSWPSTEAGRLHPIEAEYQAGYGDAGTDVPSIFSQALLLQLGTLYENRETLVLGPNANELPALTVQALLGPHRIQWSFGQ
jgi:uncharacterized phiE125 gp8 family phage protein